MRDEIDPERITALMHQLEMDPDDLEAREAYIELRGKVMGATAEAMQEAVAEGLGYQLMMTTFVRPDKLANMLEPSNPLLPDLIARVIADDVRDITYRNLQELIGLVSLKS